MIRRSFLAGLAAGALAPSLAHAQVGPQPELPKERIVIVTRDGKKHEFRVEMAVDPGQQSIGLMFRPRVAENGGMLFDWGTSRKSQMWMRNTIVSLDMLFIDQEGNIRTIAERTIPQSLAVIDSQVPVRATLELAAGTALKLDIRVGDKVMHRIFNTPV